MRSVLVSSVFLLVCACTGTTRECDPGQSVTCYGGPEGTLGRGRCHAGTALCTAAGHLGTCEGVALPAVELCDGDDNDCDGEVDEGVTNACGGCTVLEHGPGDPCPPCGAWACSGREALRCIGGHLNNCGACTASDVPGLNLACTGDNGCAGTTGCPVDGGTVATCVFPKKSNCGVCNGRDVPGLGTACSTGGCAGTLACDAAGAGSVCTGPARNNCNVCGMPPVTGVGEPCALTGSGCGVKACSAAGTATQCVASQTDPDTDGIADPCDNCPMTANATQVDTDGDTVGDACDNCRTASNVSQLDTDADTVGNACDNCTSVANTDQVDSDSDGQGDACDADMDNDGVANAVDNCPTIANANQLDGDADGRGDACDNCRAVSNGNQADTDRDGFGDVCDTCPSLTSPNQTDGDSDGRGDVCDNCPMVANLSQLDGDSDGRGDACDNCATIANLDQLDGDADGRGDVCDLVISELTAAGPGGASDEFVELYNASAMPMNVGGWFVQYAAAPSSSAWTNKATLPTGAVVPAHGFYLVSSPVGVTGYTGTTTPTLQAPTALSFAASDGHVRLVLPGAQASTPATSPLVSDLVGWGAAANLSETAPAPVPTWNSGQSLERKASSTSTAATMTTGADASRGNNRDSNDNSADFIVRPTREPQGAAAAAEVP